VPRDETIRDRIVSYLAEHGPVEESSGRATAVLKKAVAYEGSDATFTQIVAAMTKADLIARQVTGKRTYRISAKVQHLVNPEGVETSIDYDELAAALLARVTRAVAALEVPSESVDSARRQLEQLEARNAILQRDAARARAETEAAAAERDDFQAQLNATQHNLALLTGRGSEPRRPDRVSDRLAADDKALLHQLRNQQPDEGTANSAG